MNVYPVEDNEQYERDRILNSLRMVAFGIAAAANVYEVDEQNVLTYIKKAKYSSEPKVSVGSIKETSKLLDYYFTAKRLNHTTIMNKIIKTICKRLGDDADSDRIRDYLNQQVYEYIEWDLSRALEIGYSESLKELENIIDTCIDYSDSNISKSQIMQAIYKYYEKDTCDTIDKVKFLLSEFFNENNEYIGRIIYKSGESSTKEWIGHQMAVMTTTTTDCHFEVNKHDIVVTTSQTSGYWTS